MSRKSKIKDKAKGILAGIEDENKSSKEEKNKRVKKDKSKDIEEEKLKRSYMLSKERIKKLKLMQIEDIDKNLSELIEEAIDLLYEKKIG